eukprot:CAMPEP_0201967870 /NCGR_PEP_ID=MMETSP0904-20121228/12425_1 /ASSEMBLY_ACC=CAM_ASM_000553 /TAXON_ID=420261 /ORGANISM="Thalassiosira antarctica, Strain CCMP982" /LENGTH=405 /DNA_ID=CAMNT_0048515419 /DNA_START=32 /DNA_END=1246 /DNA_ORIENTATION=+
MDVQWNTTGGGGTNEACLAAAAPGEDWKCLMAPYLAPYITSPLYVMNSPFDSFSTSAILWAQCIPAPGITCTTVQTQLLKSFHAQFKADIQEAILGDEERAARNGIYSPCCYVHEQNVNYCSYDNFSPNCAGWSAQESGSKKWGYRTSVQVSDGRSLTPQQAFGAWYNGDVVAGNVTDSHEFFDNPTCAYMGKAPVIPGYPVAGTAVSDSLPCPTAAPTTPAPTAPTGPCVNGILNSNKRYCCEASCGTCGGQGCGGRTGTCCTSQIQDACVDDGDEACYYPVATADPTLALTAHPTSQEPPTHNNTSLCYAEVGYYTGNYVVSIQPSEAMCCAAAAGRMWAYRDSWSKCRVYASWTEKKNGQEWVRTPCTECTNDVTPWMEREGLTCETSTGNMANKCNANDWW